jgi:hypothetical protein
MSTRALNRELRAIRGRKLAIMRHLRHTNLEAHRIELYKLEEYEDKLTGRVFPAKLPTQLTLI